MKALGIDFCTLFGSSYACEQLLSAMIYIISDTKNRITDDLSAACIALKMTKYEPRLDKLSASIQQQKSHWWSKACQMETLIFQLKLFVSLEDLLLCITINTKDVTTIVVFYNPKPQLAHSS